MTKKAKEEIKPVNKKKKDTPLSHKQIMFCEEYIKTQNALQSYKKVYTNCKENSAGELGSRLLKKVEVKSYIQERLKPIEKKAVADADEILQLFTSIARGEVKDQLGLETRVIDRIAAGKELAKRYKLFDNPEGENQSTPKKIEIEVIDNSNLEAVMYEQNREGSDKS